jgi:DNA-binding YbaB/EbfC family protein
VSTEGEGGFDVGALFSQIGELQESLRQAQEQVVEGSAAGGAVRVKVSGALEVAEVIIDPKVVDPDDVEMLQDLVLAAIRDGMDKARSVATKAIGGAGLGGLLGPGE